VREDGNFEETEAETDGGDNEKSKAMKLNEGY
jgi:hypothetical protein